MLVLEEPAVLPVRRAGEPPGNQTLLLGFRGPRIVTMLAVLEYLAFCHFHEGGDSCGQDDNYGHYCRQHKYPRQDAALFLEICHVGRPGFEPGIQG